MDQAAAAQWGIELAYIDALGQRQVAQPEIFGRVLAALQSAGAPQPLAKSGLVADESAYQGSGWDRRWLLAVQLYAVRSGTNWGHGDFADLATLVSMAAELGAAGIGLNPLHALFPDRAEDASPYAPNSRLFLNPLYIDVTAAPGFPGVDALGLAGELERLRAADLVDYAGVARAKLAALHAAYQRFCEGLPERDEFEAFRQERRSALASFAAFETLRQKFGMPWWHWPQQWRRPDQHALCELRNSAVEELGFHEYVQWLADRQLRQCRDLAKQYGCCVGLYADLAVGAHASGADVWADQNSFLVGLSIGAPPDALNQSGQDWGLTTFNPHRLIAQDFEPFRRVLETTMRYAGAIRIDHVLGLNRIYVIPSDCSARDGLYLRFPLDSLLEVAAQTSRRQRCIIVGEDLGTVPEGFREKLAGWGLWTYVVMMFEREQDGSFRRPDRYPRNSLATFSTHDLATYAGWMAGHDLRIKRAIGIDPGETDQARASAAQALRHAVGHGVDEDDFRFIVRHLATSASRLVAVAAEDILGVQDQVNVPGTVNEHPNWRRKLPQTLEEMERSERLRDVGAIFRQTGRGIG